MQPRASTDRQTQRTLISLGKVCDVAFQLRMHTGDNSSHFFDWLVTPTEGLIHIFENDFDVFHPDHLRGRQMGDQAFVECIRSGVRFHHHFPTRRGKVYDSFMIQYPDFHGKVRFLAQRFRETVCTRPVTLVRQDISKPVAQRLETLFFALFPQADAEFLYLVPPGQGFTTAHGRSVEQASRTAGFGDITVWAAMLKEQGLVEHPYRLSTHEILAKNVQSFNFTPQSRHSDAALQQACAANPENPWFEYELASNYLNKGNADAALAEIEKALRRQGTNAEFLRVRLKAGAKLGTISAPELVAELKPLAAADPENVHIERDLLDALLDASRPEEALALANRLLAKDPFFARAYYNKARALHQLGKHDQAELAVEAAIATGPTPAHFYNFKATIAAAQERFDAAIEAQRMAVSMAGNNWQMHLRLAEYLASAGRREEALEALARAEELEPRHPTIGGVRKRLGVPGRRVVGG